MKSKGYAFVSFVKKAEAENAIQAMNGQWLGSRSIRTNWSTRKPPPQQIKATKSNRPSYEEVYERSSPTNTTVYCGGFPPNVITEELIHKHFTLFGPIQDVRVFKEKGYAFIKFMAKEAATHAIEHTNNTEITGYQVKCFWGKENGGDIGNSQQTMNNALAAQQGPPHGAQYPYSYPQVGYWYQPSYPAPAAQMPTQYMQPGYPYPYAYTNPQQGGAASFRMVQQPNVAWGVQTGMPNGNTGQPQVMYTTAMPQFQTQ